MRNFITRLSCIVLPFVIIYGINSIWYDVNEGDLTRIGLIYGNPSPKSRILSHSKPGKACRQLCNWQNLQRKTDIVTIGDSFSDQEKFGYQAYLGEYGYRILNVDRQAVRKNPIQTLIELSNGDFFDSVQTKYVILECVERELIQRCSKLNFDRKVLLKQLRSQFPHVARPEQPESPVFFSKSTLTIPYVNIQHFFTDHADFSQTIRLKAKNRALFSNSPSHLLFYQDDVLNLEIGNNAELLASSVEKLAAIAQQLEKKEITLLVLVAPDKYDIYANCIAQNPYPKPLFFVHYGKLEKHFQNPDVYTVLKQAVGKGEKNIYYYDDSHWSPIGAQLVSRTIHQYITNPK